MTLKRPTTLAQRRRRARRLVAGAVVVAAVLAGSGWAGWHVGDLLMRDQPEVRDELETNQLSLSSKVYASDGTPIYTFAQEKRDYVRYDEISHHVVEGLVATEDAQFWKHRGINPWGIARAARNDLKASIAAGRLVFPEGGSSITQQLAKLYFLSPEKTAERKIKEALLALQIEKTFTKEEILERYLNKVFYGHQRHGVEAASQFYFGKSAKELTLPEAALLAGIPQRPSRYSPITYPQDALKRRNHVLARMADVGYITRAEAEAAQGEPIQLATLETQRRLKTQQAAPFFIEDIRRQLVESLGDQVNTGGLTIQTTLDLDMQRKATRAVRDGLRRLDKQLRGFRPIERNLVREGLNPETFEDPLWLIEPEVDGVTNGVVLSVEPRRAVVRVGDEKVEVGPSAIAWTNRSDLRNVLQRGDLAPFKVTRRDDAGRIAALVLEQHPALEAALVAVDVTSGEIRAMVGGYDYSRSEFNKVTQARRQAGSAFKPIYYAAAFEQGLTPATMVIDEPTEFIDSWTGERYVPQNYYPQTYGRITLRHALEKSLNISSVRLLNYMGYDPAIDLARRLGLEAPLKPYPSLALGSFECTLLELVRAYSVFANQGLKVEPTLVRRVLDAQGNVVSEHVPQAEEVLKPDVAFQAVHVLRGVVQRGTATDALVLERPLAGKTGTTDDYSNAWFVGFSPSLVVGVWVGYEKDIQSIGDKMSGAKAALPTWIDFMREALAGAPVEQFQAPPGIEFVPVDRHTGLRASMECPKEAVLLEAFRPGLEPGATCSSAQHALLALPQCLQRFAVDESGALIVPDEQVLQQLEEESGDCPIVTDPIQRTVEVRTWGGDGGRRLFDYRLASEAAAWTDAVSIESLTAQSPMSLSRTTYAGLQDLDILDGRTVLVIRNERSRFK